MKHDSYIEYDRNNITERYTIIHNLLRYMDQVEVNPLILQECFIYARSFYNLAKYKITHNLFRYDPSWSEAIYAAVICLFIFESAL